MPHSIKVLDNTLIFLDSMRGHLINNPHKVLAKFPGFIRGVEFKNGYYYVGQSTHRYFKRAVDLMDMVSVDAGIHIYEPTTKATRFIKTNNIYDINTILMDIRY